MAVIQQSHEDNLCFIAGWTTGKGSERTFVKRHVEETARPRHASIRLGAA